MNTKLPLTNKRNRPLIAFFDFPDVFEDFYSHYDVSQKQFSSMWADTGNHTWLKLIQNEIGDVTWYVTSLNPEIEEDSHKIVGCKIKILPSSFFHRFIWHVFYKSHISWRWKSSYTAYRFYATLASYTALLSWPLWKTLKRDRPDVIFAQDYSSGKFDCLIFLARILDVPLITYHSGSQPDRYIGNSTKKWSIPKASRIIVSGKNEQERLIKRFGLSRNKAPIILTPVNDGVFSPMSRDNACELLGLNPERRYLLFMGRLDDQVKRVSTIIQAFGTIKEEHTDVDLLIAGNGEDMDKLKLLAHTIGADRIQFVGWVSQADKKQQLYCASECLLLPSLREGFPTVVAEAMLCGTPVLASRVGGVEELVVENETGWLIDPGNEVCLRNKLQYILSNKEMVRSMSTDVRKTAVNSVSFSVVAGKLKEIFLTDNLE